MTASLRPDESASYCIQIQGYLSQQWADYLAGLSISVDVEPDQTVTTLSGEVTDQAALMGVLNNLYNLGFSILSVEHQFESDKEKSHDRS